MATGEQVSGWEGISPPHDGAQTWSRFLREVEAQGRLPRPLAERAAESVMCALDQKLEDLHDLYEGDVTGSYPAVPGGVKRLLGRCAFHQASPPRPFDRDAFLLMIAKDLGVGFDQAEALARTVLATVRARLTEAEAETLSKHLPVDIRDLLQQAS